MKRILLFLLFLHSSVYSEPITAATTIGTVFLSTYTGAAMGASIVKTVGIVATCIAGWFVSKKTKNIQSQPIQKKVVPIKQEFVLQEPIRIETKNKDPKQQNNTIKKEISCYSECEQNKTTEWCAKKKSKKKSSQSTEGSIQSAAHNQPPEDDPCPPLKERKQLVKEWALKRKFYEVKQTPFKNKGMPSYKLSGRNIYVTVDADCHGGSIMKMFEKKKGKFERVGSYNKDFIRLRK